jgi:hypothetical protein
MIVQKQIGIVYNNGHAYFDVTPTSNRNTMRIKAVLRDTEILQMEAGSKERVIAAAKKNLDRVVNLTSLMKVMGLDFDDRCIMLDALKDSKIHIWLLKDAQQDLIFFSEKDESEYSGYNWQ